MKPLMLKMSAFGPFADIVEIPFHQLDSQGLFLITGNTGAGKTTIFDAISFALYGNTSGRTRTTATIRSDFAPLTIETFVYLEFLHKGKKYTVKRNPEYLRNKKNNEAGTTTHKADAVLTYPDGSVITGNTKVTKDIERLLCIDWKQFKQVAMIAQGEFLNLILEDGKERSAILRKVFNTQIYEDLQIKLKDISLSLKKGCEESENLIIRYLSDINCDEDNAFYQFIKEWKESPSIHKANEIFVVLEKLLAYDKEKLDTTKNELNRIEKEISKISVEHERAKVNNERFEKLENFIEEKKQMLEKEDEIEDKIERYSFSQKAVNIIRFYEDKFIREKNEKDSLIAFIKKTNKELSDSKEKLNESWERLEESNAKLDIAENINMSIKETENQLDLYDNLLKLKNTSKELHEDKENLLKLLSIEENKREELKKLEIKVSNELKRLENVDKDFLLCDGELNRVKQISDKIEQMLYEYNNILNDEKALEKAHKQFLELEEQYKHKDIECRSADAEFLHAQAGIMASKLIDNEECPVCGSTSHPNKASLSETLITQSELKLLKEETATLHEAMSKLSHKCGELKTKYKLNSEKLETQIRDALKIETKLIDIDKTLAEQSEINLKERQIIEREHKKLQNDIENNIKNKEKLKDITVEIEEVEKNISERKNYLNELEIEIGKLEERIKSISLKYDSKEEAIKKINEDRKEYNRLKSEYEMANKNYTDCTIEIQSLKAVLENNEEKLTLLKESYIKAEFEFTQKLKECNFKNEEDYRKYLISDDELQALNNEINEYKERKILISENINQLEIETKDKEIVSISKIMEKQKILAELKKSSGEIMQEVSNRIGNNNIIHFRVSDELKGLDERRSEFMLVEELSEVANGEIKGKQRLAFEQYIQAFYFEKVIHEANKRLKLMTSGRYKLMRKEEASDHRVKAGLEIEIMDYYTGKPRSIKSLSGGELFKASLSLALGLSDVIQSFAGGIEVDAMFIDEGFGSLDSESLESAIETLNTLTAGNRLVGIISHVEELKERIDKQIIVSKDINGSTVKYKI
ncbi:MAG: AAA family ATPase [Clostridiales bacterium]|nr:AAA family ATPase [Clostridiales bacterium]